MASEDVSGNNGRKIHFTINLDDDREVSRDDEKEQPALFQDESSILKKLNLVYKKAKQNTEHGKTSITIIDFQDDDQEKKALRLLTNHYSRVVWKVLPLLRQFGLHPRADVRYRTAQAVGDLMCEMDFIRIKDEVILRWAKHPLLEVNANVGLVFSEVIKYEKFVGNVKKLLRHWNTVSDSALNRTALASSIPICANWPEESVDMVRRALSRKTTPWHYSMEATLSAFVLRELCNNENTSLVVDRLKEWIGDKTSSILRLGAALSFLEVIDFSHALLDETGKDKIVYIYQTCLEDRRIDEQGMVRSEAIAKLKTWSEKAFGNDEKEAYIEVLFMRLYMRATTQRDKDRIEFHIKRWQKQDKEKRFGFVLDKLR